MSASGKSSSTLDKETLDYCNTKSGLTTTSWLLLLDYYYLTTTTWLLLLDWKCITCKSLHNRHLKKKSTQICMKPAYLFALSKDVNERSPYLPQIISVIDLFLANSPIPHPLRTPENQIYFFWILAINELDKYKHIFTYLIT